MLLYMPHGGGPLARPLYHLVRTDAPRTMTWGPGPVGKTLAWGGRRLQWFDRSHTWSLNHTVAMPTQAATPVPFHFGPTQFGQQTTDFFAVPVPVPTPPPVPAARATPQHASRDEEAPPAPPAPASSPVLPPRLSVTTPYNIAVVPWDH